MIMEDVGKLLSAYRLIQKCRPLSMTGFGSKTTPSMPKASRTSYIDTKYVKTKVENILKVR